MIEDPLREAIELDTREKIFRTINRNPGLHFREIQRRTEIATGSLQYHVDYLKKKNIIRQEKDGKYVRYYSTRGEQLGAENEELMSLLRKESMRRIILFLLTGSRANNERIAKAVELAPSTVSWHLKKLVETGLVEKRHRGRKSFFYLKEPERAVSLLASFKTSFLDDLVEGFVDIWEEI